MGRSQGERGPPSDPAVIQLGSSYGSGWSGMGGRVHGDAGLVHVAPKPPNPRVMAEGSQD